MGSWFSMEEKMKKNQDNMAKMQSKNMERQLEVQNQMLQKQMAMQIAGSRETCNWILAFYLTATTGLVSGYRKSKNKALIAPLVPLTFVTAYFLDLGYGNKLQRIKLEAESILVNELDTLNLPGGKPKLPPLTVEE